MFLRLAILFLRLYFRSKTKVLREVRCVLNSQRSNNVENKKLLVKALAGTFKPAKTDMNCCRRRIKRPSRFRQLLASLSVRKKIVQYIRFLQVKQRGFANGSTVFFFSLSLFFKES